MSEHTEKHDYQVPETTYKIPNVILFGPTFQNDVQTPDAIKRAMEHLTLLSIQSYALAWMELFEQHPNIELIRIDADDTGYITVRETKGCDEDDIFNEVDWINSNRDAHTNPFIQKFAKKEWLMPQQINQIIQTAYDGVLNDHGWDHHPKWEQVSAQRRSIIENHHLEHDTPAAGASTGRAGPRL